MIEDKSVFSAFARAFIEQLKSQHDKNIKISKARELLSLMVDARSHNQLIAQLPRPYEDWLESEALFRLDTLLKQRHGFSLGSNRGLFMDSVIDRITAVADALVTGGFDVKEAWILYRITDQPLETEEGNAHVFIVMDAASHYVMTFKTLLDSKQCPSRDDVEDILQAGFEDVGRWPKKLIISKAQPNPQNIKLAAKSLGVTTEKVAEQDLESHMSDVKEEVLGSLLSIDLEANHSLVVESIPVNDDLLRRANVELTNDRLGEGTAEKIMGAYLEDYYEQWLDNPIQMLNDQTPLAASQTDEGKALLESLFEQMKSLPGNAPKPDFDLMREKLGMN